MKLGASRSQLDDGQKTLRAKWDAVGEVWSDPIKVEFEEKLYEPLERQSGEVLRAIDQISAIFGQIRAECE
jgi:hypothetical protein